MTIRSVAATAAVLTLLGAGTALAQGAAFEPIPGASPLSTQTCLQEGGHPAFMNGHGYCILSGRSAVAGPPPAPVEPAYAAGGTVAPESTRMMTEGSCGHNGGRIVYHNGRGYCMMPGR